MAFNKVPVQTPYGNFESIVAACRFIAKNHADEFIQNYPGYTYNYTESIKRRYPHIDAKEHYVNNVVYRYLLGNPNYPEWKRPI
jgi:hypothetical protein